MIETATNPTLKAVDFDPFSGPGISRIVHATESQLEIWISCQLGGNEASRAYNESFSLRLTGPLQQEAFVMAFNALINRHEGLRSVFSADGSKMFVFEEVSIPLVCLDCSELPISEREPFVTEQARQDVQHLFDLTYGPLLKATLLKLSDTEHHFTLTGHHIVCDGWSVGVILQDLSALYSAYAQGQTPALPPAPSLVQYSLDEQAFIHSAEYRDTEQFWINQYRQSLPVLDLPTDFPRPRHRTHVGNRLDFPLDDALVQAVRQTGIRAGSSFVTTLLAAFRTGHWEEGS